MVRLLTITVAAALLPVAIGVWSASSDTPAPDRGAAAAQQRFQTNFCYHQYRNQSDIARCLGTGV
jgi:hypothetical protein